MNYRKYSLLPCEQCAISMTGNKHKKYCSVRCATQSPWNKGKTGIYSDETRMKMSQNSKGKHKSPRTEFKKRHSPWNKGVRGYIGANETSFKKGQHSGDKHPMWKGGITKLPGYKSFRQQNREIMKRTNGTHSILQWETLKQKYNYMCLCCKQQEPFIKLTRDHIIPIVRGGSNNIDNIQPLCLKCNMIKHAKAIDYIKQITYVGL